VEGQGGDGDAHENDDVLLVGLADSGRRDEQHDDVGERSRVGEREVDDYADVGVRVRGVDVGGYVNAVIGRVRVNVRANVHGLRRVYEGDFDFDSLKASTMNAHVKSILEQGGGYSEDQVFPSPSHDACRPDPRQARVRDHDPVHVRGLNPGPGPDASRVRVFDLHPFLAPYHQVDLARAHVRAL
jgi:hypothetical protein